MMPGSASSRFFSVKLRPLRGAAGFGSDAAGFGAAGLDGSATATVSGRWRR